MTLDFMRLLAESGVSALDAFSTTTTMAEALRRYVASLNGSGQLDATAARVAAVRDMKAHGVRDAHSLAAAAFAERQSMPKADDSPSGTPVVVRDVEPWPEPVDGADWLDRVRALFGEYLALPPHAADYLAVFALVSHVQESFDVAPYVAILSPAPECGKTRTLEVTELVVCRPWRPAVLTGAVLFRGIEMHRPTLLLDEAEVVRSPGDAAENIRAILHVGYRRGARVERCVGEDFTLKAFEVFGPKVFAAVGELPPTLLSRCVVIPMKRRGPGERVGWFRPQTVAPVGLALQQQARRWAADHLAALRALDVRAPDFLGDRRAEVWEPIVAVAQRAGGDWPERVVTAARALSGGPSTATLAVALLRDVHAVLSVRGADRIGSADLAAALNELEGHPWADWNKGNGIRPNQVARLLADFEVTPGTIRLADKTPRGYLAERFADAFARYLPLPPLGTATPPQSSQDRLSLDFKNRNTSADVAAPKTEIVAPLLACGGVAVREGGVGPSPESDPTLLAEDPNELARSAMREGA